MKVDVTQSAAYRKVSITGVVRSLRMSRFSYIVCLTICVYSIIGILRTTSDQNNSQAKHNSPIHAKHVDAKHQKKSSNMHERGNIVGRRSLQQMTILGSVKKLSHEESSLKNNDSYDLPRLLNIGSFETQALPLDGSFIAAEAKRVAYENPRSILAFYRSIQPKCARMPFRPHLHSAIRAAASERPTEKLITVVSASNTLTVQIDLSIPLSHKFRNAFRERAFPMSTVVVVPSRIYHANATPSIDHINILRQITEQHTPHVSFLVRTRRSKIADESKGYYYEDADAFLFFAAKQLLVHGGPYGALAALVCDGVVLYTPDLNPYLSDPSFRFAIRDGRDATFGEGTAYASTWQKLAPVTPTCCTIEKLGEGDGEKYVCTNAPAVQLRGDNCWVLSISCEGQWDFERHVVSRWGCKVHVFDCTGEWTVPDDIVHRVQLHKLCVGRPPNTDRVVSGSKNNHLYRSLQELISIGSILSNNHDGSLPMLVKLDAEGAEFSALIDLLEDSSQKDLPHQMIIEFHLRMWHPIALYESFGTRQYRIPPKLAFGLIDDLTAQGYKVVHRADNPQDAACTELTLMLQNAIPNLGEFNGR